MTSKIASSVQQAALNTTQVSTTDITEVNREAVETGFGIRTNLVVGRAVIEREHPPHART